MLYAEVNSKVADSISLLDRGFNYGDGVFSTGKIKDGEVGLIELHIDRIQKSCDLLHITPPDLVLLKSRMITLAKKYELAVIKIVITAGSGGRGYARNLHVKSNVIITVHDYPEHYSLWKKNGITLGKSTTQLGINPALSGLKHLNRLEQVLIRHELDQTINDEILVCNINNHLIEASSSNVFWFKGNEIFTPDVSCSGVAGLMRQHIIKNTLGVKIVKGSDENIINADAAFICNSVMGIVPIKQYLTYSYDIERVQLFAEGICDV